MSADDTVPIVMTIPPGPKREVWLGGSNREFLGTDATSRGMPCGTVFQDVFQANPVTQEGAAAWLFPSSVPSSLYCELNGEDGTGRTTSTGGGAAGTGGTVGSGSAWETGWSGLTMEALGKIDSVCRCSMTRIPAMLEMSGVYFNNAAFGYSGQGNVSPISEIATTSELTSRASTVKAKTGWTEAPAYFVPNVFYCREDYVRTHATSPPPPSLFTQHALCLDRTP